MGQVASFTGAWIETGSGSAARAASNCRLLHGGVDRNSQGVSQSHARKRRLLHGGVDRNHPARAEEAPRAQSPPSRGRGSKPEPGAGEAGSGESPPSRGRGSKQVTTSCGLPSSLSPPSRGRGSKLAHEVLRQRVRRRLLHGGVDRNLLRQHGTDALAVASFTGAWIETVLTAGVDAQGESPPSRGRGSKPRCAWRSARPWRRLLHGGVDRNPASTAARSGRAGRLLHGGVDRNRHHQMDGDGPRRRLLHGGVDRNLLVHDSFWTQAVASFTGAWIETTRTTPR